MPTNTAGLERAVRNLGREKAERLGEAFVDKGRTLAPRRTGAGADSIEAGDVQERGDTFVVEVTVGEAYMKYQNEGTGIYGPEGAPIRPTSGKVLVFDSAILGGLVFTPSVRGTEPTHWWDRTLQAWPEIVREANG